MYLNLFLWDNFIDIFSFSTTTVSCHWRYPQAIIVLLHLYFNHGLFDGLFHRFCYWGLFKEQRLTNIICLHLFVFLCEQRVSFFKEELIVTIIILGIFRQIVNGLIFDLTQSVKHFILFVLILNSTD